MALAAYTKTLVQDNVDRIVASHHNNNQENQLESLSNHGLALQSLLTQNTMFGNVSAGSGAEKPVFAAPNACRVSNLWLINGASVAANAVNNTKLELVNKGANGTGTTVLATFDGSSDSFAAFDAFVKSLAVDLAAGDVLSLRKSDTGAGAATTDLLCTIAYKPIA